MHNFPDVDASTELTTHYTQFLSSLLIWRDLFPNMYDVSFLVETL